MAYCTLEKLTERFGERLLIDATDRGDTPAEAIDTAAVTRAIADADATIDGYLKARYTLPLASVPALVESLSLTIAVYRLHPSVVSEKIRLDYQDALKTLAQISRGDVLLDVGGAEPVTADLNDVRTNNPERPLSVQSLKGFI